MTKNWKELSEVEFIDKRMYSLGEILEKCVSDSGVYIVYYSEYNKSIAITNPRDLTIDMIRTYYLSQNSIFVCLKEKYSNEIIKEKLEEENKLLKSKEEYDVDRRVTV
jgi:hypothetical protein